MAVTDPLSADVSAILEDLGVAVLVEPLTSLNEVRAIVAALGSTDDPTLRERLDRVLDRITKIEEAVALLMDGDVDDVALHDADPTGDSDKAPVVAAEVSASERERLADNNEAMPDGGFPIRDIADLHNAIRSIGRASDPAAAKRWIKKRARELNAEGDLPDAWE